MRVSGLNSNDDWTFGRGRANYKSASNAIGQNIVTRLRSFKRDWYLDNNANIDWITLLGTRGITTNEIRDQVERTVKATEGVARINKIEVNLDRVQRTVTININVTDIYNEQLLIEGLDI